MKTRFLYAAVDESWKAFPPNASNNWGPIPRLSRQRHTSAKMAANPITVPGEAEVVVESIHDGDRIVTVQWDGGEAFILIEDLLEGAVAIKPAGTTE